MSINETLKKTIDQLDLDQRMTELKTSLAELARQHGGKVEDVLDKVETQVDSTTKGKYADKVTAARRKVSESVAKVAAQPAADAHRREEDGFEQG